jgi:crossover junction endodeoxyribonuclease RusA
MSGSRSLARQKADEHMKLSDCSFSLPFPDSMLSGHHDVSWRKLRPVKKSHRELAWAKAKNAKLAIPAFGDVPVHFHFVPPNRLGDRTNYPNRIKPYIDGIADALGINDRRFLPSYSFGEPSANNARVEVTI